MMMRCSVPLRPCLAAAQPPTFLPGSLGTPTTAAAISPNPRNRTLQTVCERTAVRGDVWGVIVMNRRHGCLDRRGLSSTAAAVATLVLTVSAAVTAAASSTPACVDRERLLHMNTRPQTFNATDAADVRYITANHKTGTFLAQCTCPILGVPCLAGGGEKKFSLVGLQHTRGQGISPDHLTVNLVRNPFEMVVSGVQYHRSTKNKGEAWLYMAPLSNTHFGVPEAVGDYDAWCPPSESKDALDKTLSYQEAMNALSLNSSLVLEAFRTLHQDMGNMVVAAKRCAQVEHMAVRQHRGSGGRRMAGCSNVELEAITANFTAGFLQYLAPALHVSRGVVYDFVAQCDPTGPAATDKESEHMTAHGQQRMEAVAALREIDTLLLGGILHEVEATLAPLLMDPHLGRKIRANIL